MVFIVKYLLDQQLFSFWNNELGGIILASIFFPAHVLDQRHTPVIILREHRVQGPWLSKCNNAGIQPSLWFRVVFNHKVVSDSFVTPWTVKPIRLLCPQDFPDKNTGVGSYFLLQGLCLTQGLNLSLLNWREDSLPLSHQASPLVQGRHMISHM